MSKLTVILPAAGKGTRLNLPYPKELLRLDNDAGLIDNCFNYFKDYHRRDDTGQEVEFVVVINEDKTDLIKYLAKYKDQFKISFTFQNPEEEEYTGAIKSAYPLMCEYNLVLLPDTIMKLKQGDLYEEVMKSLQETGFVFLYKREGSHNMLKTKGALYVNEEGNIIEYKDKPKEDIGRYNAFWCGLAFRKRAFVPCIKFMERSTLGLEELENEITQTPMFGSKGIEVDEYSDLGTWPEIRKLFLQYEKDSK